MCFEPIACAALSVKTSISKQKTKERKTQDVQ